MVLLLLKIFIAAARIGLNSSLSPSLISMCGLAELQKDYNIYDPEIR